MVSGGLVIGMCLTPYGPAMAACDPACPPAHIHIPWMAWPLPAKKPTLIELLNPPPSTYASAERGQSAGDGALSSLGQALVIKPDLGACQSFAHGCHEGAIVTMPHNDVMQTMGAGLGMRVGRLRFEYAYGLHTGANFIGIRSPIP